MVFCLSKTDCNTRRNNVFPYFVNSTKTGSSYIRHVSARRKDGDLKFSMVDGTRFRHVSAIFLLSPFRSFLFPLRFR